MITRTAIVVAVLLSAVLAVGDAAAQSVSRSTFNALQRVQKLMETEEYDEALVELEELVVKAQNNPYDFALANQYLAHISVIRDDNARARRALEAALSNEGLPPETLAELNVFYGTVLLDAEEFELALEALETWFSLASKPLPSQVFSLAYANYQNGDLARAEELIERAIGEALTIQESWYSLYYRVLFDLKKYDDAEIVLKGMIERVPDNETLWRMLASHFMQLEESSQGLAAMMIAYMNEFLESDSDLRQIVALWGYIEAPEKGARLLDAWLQSGRLETNAESLKQLGNLWLLARERDKALTALTEAAGLSPDGKTYELLGGIYFEDEQWSDAYDAYQNALEEGDLDEPLRVSLLAGISAFRAGNSDGARRALEIAAEDEELRPQAESVLRELDKS